MGISRMNLFAVVGFFNVLLGIKKENVFLIKKYIYESKIEYKGRIV
jgi:hypothetical protein